MNPSIHCDFAKSGPDEQVNCTSFLSPCKYLFSVRFREILDSSGVVVTLMPLIEVAGRITVWKLSSKAQLLAIKAEEQFTMKHNRIKDLFLRNMVSPGRQMNCQKALVYSVYALLGCILRRISILELLTKESPVEK